VTGKELGEIPSFKKLREITEFVTKWLERQTGFFRDDYANNDTGWANIALTPKSIDNTLQHGAGQEKIQTIPALPELIKNGVYLESQPAHNKNQTNMTSHFFVAKVSIGGKPMVVGFIIKEDLATGRRFYDHELTEIENLDGVGPTNPELSPQEEGTSRRRQGDVMTIVRKHLSVKPGSVDEARAVAYADQMVRLTQGSGKKSDLAAAQRGGELERMFTAFYSWFNAMFNLASLTVSEVKWADATRDKAGIAASFLFFAWIGTQACEIALDALRDRTPDDDDDDEWAKYLAGKFTGFWTGMIPLARDAADALIHGWDYELTGVGRGPQVMVKTVQDVLRAMEGRENALKRAAVGAARSAGYAAGLPLEPVAQIIKMVADYADGATPEMEIRKALLR
jgi:hypothetical protein